MSKKMQRPFSEDDIDAFFKFLGQYVATFQYIESLLDQVLLLAVGQERRHVGQSVIAKMTNRTKIDTLRSIVAASAIADGDGAKREWLDHFENLMLNLEQEGGRRNKIVHSQYLFDFVKIGQPPLRSKRTMKKGGVSFDMENFDLLNMKQILKEISELAYKIGQIHLQLIHWNDYLVRGSSKLKCPSGDIVSRTNRLAGMPA